MGLDDLFFAGILLLACLPVLAGILEPLVGLFNWLRR